MYFSHRKSNIRKKSLVMVIRKSQPTPHPTPFIMANLLNRGPKRVTEKLTNPLPLADPAVFRLSRSDHSVEVGGGAVVDVVPVVSQIQDGLAVVTSVVLELLESLKSILSIRKSNYLRLKYSNEFKLGYRWPCFWTKGTSITIKILVHI